jgi:hypothetical protein
MKRIVIFCVLVNTWSLNFAQDSEVKLKDLAVPNSPAFILNDIVPTLIQTPNTPKAFVLGAVQSFQQSTGAFPQNYSADFAPFWWLKPSHRNVYSLVGLKTKVENNVTSVKKQDPFSGLKFTSLSMAFLTKDYIPDTINLSQKVFSVGIKTTLVKVHSKTYDVKLKEKISEWHITTLSEFDKNIALLTEISKDPSKTDELTKKFKKLNSSEIVKQINEIMNQKPLFCWELASAYSTYGIGDTSWKTGRYGVWTTVSSYIPFGKNTKNYFNINLACRYLTDNYNKGDNGIIGKSNSIDVGGKIAFEFDELSIGVESLYRFNNSIANTQNRTVGVVNYKIADNLFINGAFGKNFDSPNKLITLFGVNWGFGSETAKLTK